MEAKSFAPGQYVERLMIVGLAGNGRISGDAVVVSFRTLMRGKRSGMVEYQLAPMVAGQWGARVYGCSATGTKAFTAPSRTYTVQEAQERAATYFDTAQEDAAARHALRTKNQDALDALLAGGAPVAPRTGEPQIVPVAVVGSTVRVKWRNGVTFEHVVAINAQTGKVAIRQPGTRTGKRWIPSTIILPAVVS